MQHASTSHETAPGDCTAPHQDRGVTGADGTQRLYVGYIKSGDIMQVLNPSGRDHNNAGCADGRQDRCHDGRPNLVNAVAGPRTPPRSARPFASAPWPPPFVSRTADGTTCTATSPAVGGAGVVDVRVTNVEAQTSAVAAADQFTYNAAQVPPGAPVISGISPSSGLTVGGTVVTVTGTGLTNPDGSAAVSFDTNPAGSVVCTVDGTTCAAASPASTNNQTVDVQVTTVIGTSAVVVADRFMYLTPVGALVSCRITAPKGGVTFVPTGANNANGHQPHFWVSDHANGLCRLDPVPSATIFAPHVAVCDPGFTIGSPGQAVWEPGRFALPLRAGQRSP
jgi:IPT/TIG domain